MTPSIFCLYSNIVTYSNSFCNTLQYFTIMSYSIIFWYSWKLDYSNIQKNQTYILHFAICNNQWNISQAILPRQNILTIRIFWLSEYSDYPNILIIRLLYNALFNEIFHKRFFPVRIFWLSEYSDYPNIQIISKFWLSEYSDYQKIDVCILDYNKCKI